METKFGFTKMNVATFESWIQNNSVGRTVLKIQMHHTFIPSYAHFTGANHFAMQRAMQNHHVHSNGWRDIGQHFSIFPDGEVVTGRSLEFSPACIYQNNQDSICIENVGYFDTGQDVMRDEQKQAIISATAALCKKFNLPVNTDSIIYHHWFRLDNGHRNNGAGGNKSCPGTNFFGGNKPADCQEHFIPLVEQKLGLAQPPTNVVSPQKYVIVTAMRLNVRINHSGRSSLAPDREPLRLGSVLRVYDEQNGWLKISNSKHHWVYSRYTDEVKRYQVNTTSLNVRSGPSVRFQKVGQVHKNEQVFIVQEDGNWAKIAMDNRWVSKSFLTAF
jgi:ribosomal protein S17